MKTEQEIRDKLGYMLSKLSEDELKLNNSLSDSQSRIYEKLIDQKNLQIRLLKWVLDGLE